MAKQSNQKGKLLLELDFLRRETDEEHSVSTQDILDHLAQNGVSAERKSVYSDLDVLADYGYDIQRRSGPGGGVWLGGREFELAELKLLVDAVESSRFITKRKSAALIEKLSGLTSRHQAKALQRQVFMGQRVKSMNESAYYCVDAIHTAISQGNMVSFRYFDFDSNKEKVYHRQGATYLVSPYCLVWDNANYYLVGREKGEEQTRHYRVDKMDRVEASPQRADVPRDFDPAAYTARYFSMFSGRQAQVRLRCHQSLAGVILDRFGREVMLVPDGAWFTVTLDVVISPQFWGWLTALGPKAKLTEPAWAAEEYRAYLQSLMEE